jgi:hypothetical protein
MMPRLACFRFSALHIRGAALETAKPIVYKAASFFEF